MVSHVYCFLSQNNLNKVVAEAAESGRFTPNSLEQGIKEVTIKSLRKLKRISKPAVTSHHNP